jgi:hypothetical protein
VSLSEDVSRIAVLAVDSAAGERVYLCAFADGEDNREWLALDADGAPLTDRARVREAASIAALVEVAEEAAEQVAEAPRVASLPYLDSIGGDSSIAAALPAVDELTREIERHYKLELSG